ncbi:hypothetical protein PB2503_13244 [Parvularcula bermudensis HTCC2503]|uniref:Uncharacterized protein n=1 Tax=Parvularcula bermudensis (strain ATCC BAA-594 / HTCC2503 / KCTC 12087) TaxID=314260 RepID=E0TGS7_PARBH|nr:hypothetical protein [Parvularcula bermudensis]ADM10686.1 hypothetical protein PB2503_13244 [Parvularcula bermudensis HTCC2503]
MGLTAPIIVGFCGIGAEIGYWQMRSNALQGASDSAAFSAAAVLTQGMTLDDAQAAALRAALAKGLSEERLETPIVHHPPVAGAYAGDPNAVEVVLFERVKRHFSALYADSDTIRLSARAVARTAGSRPACILALHATEPAAIRFSGSSSIELDGCDITSNSIASNAIDFSGSTGVTAECVSAVGGVEGHESALTLTDCFSPYEYTRRFADPYASLAVPAAGPCSTSLKGALNSSPSDVVTVNPGTVCAAGAGGSTLQIKGDVTFNAGLYIFSGVEIRVNSTADLSGTGVTFVLRDGARMRMNGGAVTSLTAPADPANDYHGVLMFADPSDTAVNHILNGNSATSFTGVLYFPNADVTYSGSNFSGGTVCTILVGSTISFEGNSYFGSDCSGLGISDYETAQVILIKE